MSLMMSSGNDVIVVGIDHVQKFDVQCIHDSDCRSIGLENNNIIKVVFGW